MSLYPKCKGSHRVRGSMNAQPKEPGDQAYSPLTFQSLSPRAQGVQLPGRQHPTPNHKSPTRHPTCGLGTGLDAADGE